jgi:outer membrane biosynthesis protein TonB
MKEFIASALIVIFLLLVLASTPVQAVTLSWTANAASTDPNIKTTGYKVHLGGASGQYTQAFDAALNTSFTLPTTLASGTYFAVVKAYNAALIESGPSNEVTFTIVPAPTPTPTPSPTPTSTPTPTPTATPTPPASPTPTVPITPTPSPSATPKPTTTPSPSASPATIAPPVLSAVPSSTSIVINWTESDTRNGWFRIRLGNQVPRDVTNHTVTFTSLQPNTSYQATGQFFVSGTALSSLQSAPITVVTTGAAATPFPVQGFHSVP